jgi:hypothetical protein
LNIHAAKMDRIGSFEKPELPFRPYFPASRPGRPICLKPAEFHDHGTAAVRSHFTARPVRRDLEEPGAACH